MTYFHGVTNNPLVNEKDDSRSQYSFENPVLRNSHSKQLKYFCIGGVCFCAHNKLIDDLVGSTFIK